MTSTRVSRDTGHITRRKNRVRRRQYARSGRSSIAVVLRSYTSSARTSDTYIRAARECCRMTIAFEQRRALPEGRRVGVPLLKASLIASLIFALAWIRLPLSASNFASVAAIFVGCGILITILAMVLGSPLVRLLERRRMNRWWSLLAAATATGCLTGSDLLLVSVSKRRGLRTPGERPSALGRDATA